MPYQELPHTADWALHVWAPDLAGLFAEAARGMNALTGAEPGPGPRTSRTFEAVAADPEGLLVAFLSELVYAAEQDNLVFDQLNVTLEAAGSRAGWKLRVEMSGAAILSIGKAIKAVTYHNLKIRQSARGYEVEIVFDV